LGLLGFDRELKCETFGGSCVADHRQNQHFRSEQNKALGAKIFKKIRDLRFNNNPEALIFGSFDQAKEQRSHFKINRFKITTN
jgi:hypothetical protein